MRLAPSARALFAAVALLAAPAAAAAQGAPLTSKHLENLDFRSIGPAVMGGRIHDVEALPNDPATIFVATASGGLWKTVNMGTTWTSLFDDQAVSTFGDVAIAASDPDVVWAGTGEQNNRQSSSWGNGVYRSTDGGESWTHLGLTETRHIGRVVVDPRDAEVAYVAALGNLWAASADRGVYKTADGGRSWDRVLFVDTLTGVVDLAMDPSDPNTLYAAAYQRLRTPWGFNGGGPGSGIYKTIDGGRTWSELTSGIPDGGKGRIGLAVSRTDPGLVLATVEHASEGGIYRSEDGGRTWTRASRMNPRPMYYSHIYIDPTDANRVYVLATDFFMSEDGGRTFRQMPTAPTYDVGAHGDFHALWIDPNDSEHFYLVGDGGFYDSWDRGETYEKINNFPIGQFYAIDVDMREPYYVHGGLQDNHSWMGPSRTRRWIGIINDDWRQTNFGDGMYQQADPSDSRFVYTSSQNGNVSRLDTGTGDLLDVKPTPPPGEEEYRFDWTSPILVSRHDPATVYLGGNRLFISRDRGLTWERTEDLTRRIDRDTLPIMGVPGARIELSRHDGESSYSEATTISESPLDASVLWVGMDDGNVQLSRDGGRSWTEVSRNVPGVPAGTYVSRVLASGSAPGTAYASFDAHRSGDFSPYVFRTTDFGRTWIPLHAGLPSGSVNVIEEHPRNPNLLFVGTEHALWVSGDAGTTWARFGGLPTTAFDDLVIHPREDDLVVATHGRSLWILDDLAPLAGWSPEVTQAPAYLFPVRSGTVHQYWKDTSYRGQGAFAGENAPDGTVVSYHLSRPATGAALVVRDASGREVRRMEVPGEAGTIHRVVWDLRHGLPFEAPDEEESDALPVPPHPLGMRGPFVSPGTYAVTLEAGGQTASRPVEVRGDPELPTLTVADYQARERFLLDLLGMMERIEESTERTGALHTRLEALRDSLSMRGGSVVEVTTRLDSVTVLEDRLGTGSRFRGLRGEIASLYTDLNGGGVRQGSLFPPTPPMQERKRVLEEEVRALLEALDRVGR